jgi:hypothetical protein
VPKVRKRRGRADREMEMSWMAAGVALDQLVSHMGIPQ